MVIEIIGFSKLNSIEQDNVKRISDASYDKISRLFDNETDIEIKVIKHDKGGKPRYEAKARVDVPEIVANASFEDFDISVVMHSIFNKLFNEIENKIGKKNVRKKIDEASDIS